SDAQGNAIAPVLTANTVSGTFTVIASITGFAQPVTFTLTNTPGAATTFDITGFPQVTTAGEVHDFNVTARDQFGNIDTTSTGTVHFASADDPRAILPADTTFTLNDAGVERFRAAFITAGIHSFSVFDVSVSNGTVGNSGDVFVSPAATARLAISDVSPNQVAGTPFTFTVTAFDEFGNITGSTPGLLVFTS